MSAKDIVLKPIDSHEANALVKRVHYSGKVVQNSQIHIGVFYDGKLEGAMRFGPSLDKRKIQGLVRDTGWHEFIELNRMAFSDVLPRNSESRALGIAIKLLRKHAPQLKWVVSFADATQCGDGTIYRAAGFVLTGVKGGAELLRLPSGEVRHRIALHTNAAFVASMGGKMASLPKMAEKLHAEMMPGYMIRYIYFIDPAYRARLTVKELPYSAIAAAGASMYKGQKPDHASEVSDSGTPAHQPEGALQCDPDALVMDVIDGGSNAG